jgi:hypothetical protein
MKTVRDERTGWRDEKISGRHRKWGWNCPAVDLDFVMVEYHMAKPVGLIEYKHYKAQMPDFNHATYRALGDLANRSNLPFMLAFYWPDIWAFRVHPLNQLAARYFNKGEVLTERDFVATLYRIRNWSVGDLYEKLNDILPGDES